MQDQPIRDPSLLEAIEACRPGSDDLSDPALAFLAAKLDEDADLAEHYQNIQELDGKITEAFCDVPVPEGLSDRLLARLAVQGNGRSGSTRDDKAEIETAETTPPESVRDVAAERVAAPRRVSRRLVLGGAITATVAASVLVAILLLRIEPSRPLSQEDVQRQAMAFFDADRHSLEEGLSLAEASPPEDYPFSHLIRFEPVQWRGIRGFLGRHGVAYDIVIRDRCQATLYVVECSVSGLPSRPQADTFNSGGRFISTWQSDKLLYVLVVQGEERHYRQLLTTPGGPLA